MAYQQEYDNTNTGLLKRNDRKDTDKHPDYKGTINIEGVDYWLSGWLRVGKEGGKLAGQKYFSLAVQRMEEQQERRPPARQPETRQAPARQAQRRGGSGFDDMDDDIPF